MKKITKLLILSMVVLCVICSISITVGAATEYTEGYYTYTVSGGVATITDCDTAISGDITIPTSLGGYPVTAIDNYVFFLCKNITSVKIPDNIISIGEYSFRNCENLKSAVIGNGVTSIESFNFSSCDALENVYIGRNVATISRYAFTFNNNLINIDVDSNNQKFCDVDGTLYNKDMTLLMKYPAGKDGTLFVVPSSVTTIREDAFSYCKSLKEIKIHKGVTFIGNGAFEQCSSLSNITVDASNQKYKSIDGVLYDNRVTGLIKYPMNRTETSYTIPNGVSVISADCFNGCKYIENVLIPDTVTYIGESAFAWSNLLNVNIPGGVETIQEDTFSYCYELISVTIQDGVKTIGGSAFQSCNALITITIPASVTSIGNYAFSNCSSLANVTIGANVTSIGSSAFNYCRKLKNVHYIGTSEEWNKITIGSSNTYLTNASKTFEYQYTITYNANGGENAPLEQRKKENIDLRITQEKPTRSKYMFLGWSTSSAGSVDYSAGDVYSKNSDATLYAVWEELFGTCNTNVSWSLDIETGELSIIGSGTVPNYSDVSSAPWSKYSNYITSVNIEKGIKSIGTNAFANTYNIDSVYYEGTKESLSILSGNTYFKNADTTYGEYNIYYHVGGGNNAPSTQIKTRGTNITLSSAIPTKDEYLFLGWSTTENGDVDYLPQSTYSADSTLNLYAVWSQSTSGTCGDDIVWSIDAKTGTLKLSGSGKMYNYTTTNKAPWYMCCFNIKSVQMDNGITYIGTYAFNNCSYLNTVKYNGTSSEFKNISIGTGNTTFKNASKKYVYYVDIYDFSDNLITQVIQEIDSTINLSNIVDETSAYHLYYDNKKFQRYTKTTLIKSNLKLYIDIFEPTLETISISGRASADIGEIITETIYFATNKEVDYLYCNIKYPNELTLKEIIPVDFMYVEEDTRKTENGFTTVSIYCQYSNSGVVDKNKTIIPFELTFDVDKYATVDKDIDVIIEILNTTEYGATSVMRFSGINNTSIDLLPKLAEAMIILGEDEIYDSSIYAVTISPDYTTVKEVEWSVSDTSIATITQDGVLKPVKNGQVTIFAKTLDGSNIVAEKVVTVFAKARLDGLISTSGEWEISFESNTRNYVVYVPEDSAEIGIVATYSGAGTLRINDKLTRSGATRNITLTDNTLSIPIVIAGATDYADGLYTITVVRTKPFTKAYVSDDGKLFNIRAYLVEDGNRVILSLYEDEKFVKIYDDVTVSGKTIPFNVTESYDTAKVMVWDNLTNLKPVCEVEIIE